MKAETFDRKFDQGDELTQALDVARSSRPVQAQKRVNVDFPNWMIERLDREARRLGVSRQSIIKVWLSERLEQVASGRAESGRADSGRADSG